ncbi:hypothetical protein K474DRAFT_1773175 [Panus rudis PR-1116 ss-1]|nr:hypothetical protein K474DRAFT_1773175 [Panus rudis PR-1116 ss-1]
MPYINPPMDMEAAAARVYQSLLLLRANDKNIWPALTREKQSPRMYEGSRLLIARQKFKMTAMLDALAYLSVTDETRRVAITTAITPSLVTLLVAQDGHADSQPAEHISLLWSLLRKVKDSVDKGDRELVRERRRDVYGFLYKACIHYVVKSLRVGVKEFQKYTSVMRTRDGIQDLGKHEDILHNVETLIGILLDRSDDSFPIPNDVALQVFKICESFSQAHESCHSFRSWNSAYRSTAGDSAYFDLREYLYSICTLHRHITYLSLLPSPRCRYREILSRPFEVVAVPTKPSYPNTIDVSVPKLFSLLKETVDRQEPEPTLDRLMERISAELPDLTGKTQLVIDSHAHCECAVLVFAHNHFLDVSHIAISSTPCFPCSRFLLACWKNIEQVTNTFDKLYQEELDLPWSLPPPFQDHTSATTETDRHLTSMVWSSMSFMVGHTVAYMWSQKGGQTLVAYKNSILYKGS